MIVKTKHHLFDLSSIFTQKFRRAFKSEMPYPEEHVIGRISFSVNKSLKKLIVFFWTNNDLIIPK